MRDMDLKRLFSTGTAKGKPYYISTQKKYELARTCLYFVLAFSVFALGYYTTKSRANLLTVVAILGCLPACKSLVLTVVYLRARGLSEDKTQMLLAKKNELVQAYDMVFTTYNHTFEIQHLVIFDKQICGYTENKNFSEEDFSRHIKQVCGVEGYKDISIKVFNDFKKYQDRIEDLYNKQKDIPVSKADVNMLEVLKSVSL